MSVYYPDFWSIIQILDAKEPLYKVFACWSGSYLYGDSWKINSGIESIEETEHTFLFDGYSGSTYECAKDHYGMSVYGMNVYQSYAKQINLKLLTHEEALEYIKEKLNA